MSATVSNTPETASAEYSIDRLAFLLDASNRDDREAYILFLEEIASITRAIIAAHGGDLPTNEQEKIVQETLIAVHRKRHTWYRSAPIGPWLATLIHYQITASFLLRGRQVFLKPEVFSVLLPDASARDAAMAAFGNAGQRSVIWRRATESVLVLVARLRRRSRTDRSPER